MATSTDNGNCISIDDVYVDEELSRILPKPSQVQVEELRKSVLADGFREPITVWSNPPDGKPLTLADGYRRVALRQTVPELSDAPLVSQFI